VFANGIAQEFDYGPDDEVSRVRTYDSSRMLLTERRYRYAPNGELTEAETVGGERLTFSYDAEYQLTEVAGPESFRERFVYDLDENIVYSSRLGRHRHDGSRLAEAGEIRYEYDGAGRVSTRWVASAAMRLTYGIGGLVRSVELADGRQFYYEYDGYGRRVRKTGPDCDSRFHWDEDVLLSEERVTPSGRQTIEYWYLPGGFVPLGHAVDGECFYYDRDQRCQIREVYDSAGSLVARFDYDAFGNRRISMLARSAADPPFRLLGQMWDEETGLCYNRFRYFDPLTGRFLSPDLSLHQVEHNSYSYSPNPINWSDPFGLMARFSTGDALSLVEEGAQSNGGWFECVGCGFKNKNRIFARVKNRNGTPGRHVGDGCFQAGHKKAHAKGGSANPDRNGQVEGGTCNCSKGKRKSSGMT
jgi:RHS repeat-associated protein